MSANLESATVRSLIESGYHSNHSNQRLDDYDRRKVVIKNLPSREKHVRDELLGELEKDEHMFGPIRDINLIDYPTYIAAYVVYENRKVHKDVIEYYNSILVEFHGNRLVFEAAKEYTNFRDNKYVSSISSINEASNTNSDSFSLENEKEATMTRTSYSTAGSTFEYDSDWRSSRLSFEWTNNDYHKRDIVILNVPNVKNIDEEIWRELRKDKDLFGPVECVRISPSPYRVTRAFVQYADTYVHEVVIRYYRSLMPTIHENILVFEPSHRLIKENMKHRRKSIASSGDINMSMNLLSAKTSGRKTSTLSLSSSLSRTKTSSTNSFDHHIYYGERSDSVSLNVNDENEETVQQSDYNQDQGDTVLIMNVKNKQGIENDLLKELKKDEHIFGPIAKLKLAKTSGNITQAYVRYVNRYVHKDVVRHYESLMPVFHGQSIYFNLSKNEPRDSIYLTINCAEREEDKDDDYKTISESSSTSSSSCSVISEQEMYKSMTDQYKNKYVNVATQTEIHKCDVSTQTYNF